MIKKVINYVYICLLIIVCLAFLADLFFVIKNPEEYRIGQGFPEGGLKWSGPDVLQYIMWDILYLFIGGFFLTLAILYLKRKGNKLLTVCYYISMLIFLGVAIFNYYQWMKTEFDH